MSKLKTPIANDEETTGIGDAPEPLHLFWVQVVFIGIGVVPFCALHCSSLNDVLQLLHRPDPADQYFDALSESKQQTRIYRPGVAAVTERSSSVPEPRILRPTNPLTRA